jgi:hypothetical protein
MAAVFKSARSVREVEVDELTVGFLRRAGTLNYRTVQAGLKACATYDTG